MNAAEEAPGNSHEVGAAPASSACAQQTVDYLIVGAGLSGLTMAERLCAGGRTCLIVDRRLHIGGNCYDYLDEHGSWVSQYGPHFFGTSFSRVFAYLSRFTKWIHIDSRGLSQTDQRYRYSPTHQLAFGRLAETSRTIDEVYARLSLDDTSRTASGTASAFGQIQALPEEGYTAMFENMLAACGERASVRLGFDYREISQGIPHRYLIYTGSIDAYFGYRFGRLPYRALRFDPHHFPESALKHRSNTGLPGRFWQPAVQVSYSGAQDYTRTIELKHLMPTGASGSTVLFEYPEDRPQSEERYCPTHTPASQELYRRYARLAEKETNVSFVGRLPAFQNYSMDEVVALALAEAERLATRFSTGPST